MSSIKNLNDAIKKLSFANADKLNVIDLSSIIGVLAQCYEQLAPLSEKQIKLYYSGLKEDGAKFFMQENLGEILVSMLQSGTKIFDAIMWIGVRLAEKSERFSKYFEFDRGNSCSIENQNRSLTILAANWLLFITRGSFPNRISVNDRAPLPRFISSMIVEYNIKDEANLYTVSTSFDLKHIKVDNLIMAAPKNGWDEIVLNRMNLGVAGHKSIKAASDLSSHYMDKSLEQNKMLEALVIAGSKLNTGFYPSLHPSTKKVADVFQKFHVNSLHIIFSELKGDDDYKYGLLSGLDYLRNDQLIKNRSFKKITPTWKNWKVETFTATLGALVMFSSKNRLQSTDEILGLVRIGSVELPENKSLDNANSEKSKSFDLNSIKVIAPKKDLQETAETTKQSINTSAKTDKEKLPKQQKKKGTPIVVFTQASESTSVTGTENQLTESEDFHEEDEQFKSGTGDSNMSDSEHKENDDDE